MSAPIHGLLLWIAANPTFWAILQSRDLQSGHAAVRAQKIALTKGFRQFMLDALNESSTPGVSRADVARCASALLMISLVQGLAIRCAGLPQFRWAGASVARPCVVLAQRLAANARQKELASRSAVTATADDEAQRDVDLAAADLAAAQCDVTVMTAQSADARAILLFEQALLDHPALSAPFDAVIVERRAEASTAARAGEVIFTLMAPMLSECHAMSKRAGPVRLCWASWQKSGCGR